MRKPDLRLLRQPGSAQAVRTFSLLQRLCTLHTRIVAF